MYIYTSSNERMTLLSIKNFPGWQRSDQNRQVLGQKNVILSMDMEYEYIIPMICHNKQYNANVFHILSLTRT